MPVFTDEDVGLGSSYLSDEDVGLGDEAPEGGDETWSPEEQARLEAEQAGLAPETGLRAGLRRFRAGPTGRALFGPTEIEREAGAGSTGSPGEIASAALKFMTVPPQLANPIRAVTEPAIEMLPPALAGVATGVREVALSIPGPSFAAAPRLAMAAFGAQTIADLPDAKRAYEDALERGDTKTAATIATQTVGNTALLGLGAAAMGPRRFTPPERGGIPEPVRPANEPAAPVLDKPSNAPPAKGPEAVLPADVQKAGAIREAEPQVEVQGGGKELSGVQEASLDKSKWTKATDTENLRAATPEQRITAAQKPLDVESFTMTDKEGFKAVDGEKLSRAVEGGHITSGDTAVDALLLYLIKPSENHPLTSIRMLDFTPGEAQLLTGTSAPFHGRFSKQANKRRAMVEMTMKMQDGKPVTAAQFMETVTHELGHNNITSKFKDAPPEIQADVDNLFKFVQEKGKGTEFEQHNALTSAHELFAELADPKVYKWLSELDYAGDIRKVDVGVAQVPAISPVNIRNSALGRFLEIAKKLLKLPDFITDAFGNKVETITALDQMVSLSSRLERVRRTGGEPEVELNRAKDEPKRFPNKGAGSPADEYGAIYGPKLPPEAAARFRENTGESVELPSPEKGVSISAQFKGNKIWVQADRPTGRGGEVDQSVAYLHVREDGTTVLDASRHGRPLDEMAKKALTDFLGTLGSAKKAKATEVGRPQIEASKDFKSEIADVEKVSNEELVKQGGSVTQFMWKLGAKAKTAEDVAALREMAEKSDAKANELMKAGDFEGAMAIAGRQPAEAYEYATGVKVDGQPKWTAFEKVNPGYVPPVPDASYVAANGGETKPAKTETIPPVTETIEPKTPTVAPISETPAPEQKWTGATESTPETGIGGQMLAGVPNPAAVVAGIKQAVKDYGPGVKRAGKAVSDAVEAIYKENLSIRKMNDLDRSVLNWSAKLQRSFGESMSAQKEIQRVAKSKVSDEALSNWLEAHGDTATLTAQRDATTDQKLKAGYEAALNLTPEQVQMAQGGRGAYDQLWKRAERWGLVDKDPTKPSSFRDDYVTHIWNLGKGAFAGGSRTLKDQFKFAKARTFQNYFEGEQAGFKPKTKRLSQLLPIYIHEMNSVIAAKQLVKQMWGGKAKDGSPLLATRGQATPVSGAKGEAVLVKPEAASPDSNKKGLDISKYKEIPNQPALHDWTFIGKDTAGNPVYEKSDLVLHPEAYKKLNAILGKSKIREWYEGEGSATMAIPKAIAKGLDLYQQETKRTMFGLLAPFHQVQEGWHGVGHRILPSPVTGGDSTKAMALKLPKPDLDNPEIYDMAKNGLMILPDRASEAHFMEGMRHSGLVSHIPGIGKLSDGYSKYLFHEVIPGLKIKTYAAALERNKGVYKDDLASGEVNLEDVKLLTATQVNAAYGHLNYADLGRNPTFQHILQLGLLAPDFLEARARFFGQGLKGATGAKVGREQLYALATLAAAQALLAYTSAQLVDGEWDEKHPFEMRKGNRKYTLRSVPEDAQRFFEDIGNIFSKGGEIPFISHRLNPITGRGPLQLLTGRDWRQQKITPQETAKQLALAPIPLTARGFMDIDKSPLEEWEQLAGSAGLKIMRYSPQNEVRKLFNDWKKQSENPRLVEQAEQAEAQTFGESEYADLRQAMEKNNFQLGAEAYEKLLETHSAKEIKRAMNPVSVDPETGLTRDKMLPKGVEAEFLGSLKDEEREVYEEAKRERRLLYQRFQRMLSE